MRTKDQKFCSDCLSLSVNSEQSGEKFDEVVFLISLHLARRGRHKRRTCLVWAASDLKTLEVGVNWVAAV